MPATLLKKRLWHWRFPVNFVKFLRTPYYRTPLDDCFCYNSVQNTLGKSKKSSKVGQEQNIFISTFALFFSTSTKHLFLEGRLPIGQICIVECSRNIPMIYSQNIRKKLLMKFRGVFPNNVPGILNIGIFSECSMNILRMLHALFSVDQEIQL